MVYAEEGDLARVAAGTVRDNYETCWLLPGKETVMLTIDALRAFGANVDEGLARCMNSEAFYLRLVKMSVKDACFDRLAQAVGDGDKQAAFEAAHDLKGVLGNLSLTPIYAPVSQMTELLRAGEETDYSAFLAAVLDQRDKLKALCEE